MTADPRRREERCSHDQCRLHRKRHSADGSCPRGGKTFRQAGEWKPRPVAKLGKRVPMSVNDGQALALHEVLACIQRGGDPRLIAKMHSKALGKVLGITQRALNRRRKNESAASATASAATESLPPPGGDSAVRLTGVGAADLAGGAE